MRLGGLGQLRPWSSLYEAEGALDGRMVRLTQWLRSQDIEMAGFPLTSYAAVKGPRG